MARRLPARIVDLVNRPWDKAVVHLQDIINAILDWLNDSWGGVHNSHTTNSITMVTGSGTMGGAPGISASSCSPGALTLTQGTIIDSCPAINHTVTLNDGAEDFTIVKSNVTDTASGSGTKLADLQVGAASKLYVGKRGQVRSSKVEDLALYDTGFEPAYGFTGTDLLAFYPGANVAGLGMFDPNLGAPNLFLHGINGVGTDASGQRVEIYPGAGTGTAGGGNFNLSVTPPSTVSGSTPNAYQGMIHVSGGDGLIQIGQGADWHVPNGIQLNSNDRATSFTDGSGASIRLIGGKATGTGTPGGIQFESWRLNTASGTTQTTTAITLATFNANGTVTIGGADHTVAPGLATLAGGDRIAGVTDGSAGGAIVRGGQSTGTGVGSSVQLQISPPGLTGSSQNALQNALNLASNGSFTLGNVSIFGTATTSVVAGQNHTTSEADGAAGSLVLRGGRSTGTGASGTLSGEIATSAAASSSAQNTLQVVFAFNPNGTSTFGGLQVPSAAVGQTSILGAEPSAGRTDTAANQMNISPGSGTGTGAGGNFVLNIAPPGATGSTQNANQVALQFSGSTGAFSAGGLNIIGTPGTTSIAACDRAAGVTDGSAGDFHIDGGISTGTGTAGTVDIRLAPPASGTGTTQNSLVDIEQWATSSLADPEQRTATFSGSKGATCVRGSFSELLTLNTGSTTTDTTANLLPANSLILAVTTRVTTTITTATTFSVGDPTTAARFSASAGGLSAGVTRVGLQHQQGSVTTDAAGPVQTSAAKVRITTDANPGAGVVRIEVFYLQFTAPTA